MSDRRPRSVIRTTLIFLLFSAALGLRGDETSLRGALLSAEDVDASRIAQLKASGMTAIVISLPDDQSPRLRKLRAASRWIREQDLALYYWIEVGRCPTLADRHPKWMASQQTHAEWRRLFPGAPVPGEDQVVKTYPWVPILSRETFDAQLARVKALLQEMPTPQGVFLNDLQGAPSACGCGNSLCRWTSDYGKRRTTTPLGDDAAARFLMRIGESVPGVTVIPVWTTECEEHDGAADGLCAGVGCFRGICWKAWTAQLAPVEQSCGQIGVMTTFRSLQRDLPRYGGTAAWVAHAIDFFANMPRKYDHAAIEPSRLITILQGWDVSDAEVKAQIQVAETAGVGGYIVAYQVVEKGWQPRLESWP